MTTFNTPFGRYRYLKMLYGIKTAPEIFHRIYKEIFEGIPNVENYIDDMIVWAENEQEMKRTLEQIFKRAHENGVKFNLKKCEFNKDSIIFLGHRFSKDGIAIDESRLEAISKMEAPKDKKESKDY